MYAKENNMADAGIKASAKLWNRQWTETELKYFALVLAGEKHEFSYKLDTLALKKTANKTVFENIEKASEERMSSGEFKRENEQQHRGSKLKKDLPRLRVDVERLRVWKMMKSEGWKISNVNTNPLEELDWYKIINPISSDTRGNFESDEEQTDKSRSSHQEEDGESINVEPGIRCSLFTRCQHSPVNLLKYNLDGTVRFNLDVFAHHL